MNRSNDYIGQCFKRIINARQDYKFKDWHSLSQYTDKKPEDVFIMLNSRSGIKEHRDSMSATPEMRETFEILKSQKVHDIVTGNRIEREFTGNDLYQTLNQRENYELLCELIGEEKTEAARQEAKRLGKRAIILKKLTKVILGLGLYIGPTLAMIISWSINHSIFWAIAHGLLGWFYVLYFMMR